MISTPGRGGPAALQPRLPRIPAPLLVPESRSRVRRTRPGTAGAGVCQPGSVPGHAATSGLPGARSLSGRAGCPGRAWHGALLPGAGSFVFSVLHAAPSRAQPGSFPELFPGAAGSRFSVARGRVAGGPWLFPIPIRVRVGERWSPPPSGFPLLLPLLRVPELSLCLLWPLGLCSLPAVLLYIPKIM